MPRKRPPDPPEIDLDWREFVDDMRSKRLHREFNRPSELLRTRSMLWRDSTYLRRWDWQPPSKPVRGED